MSEQPNFDEILNNRVSQRISLQIGTLTLEKIAAEEAANLLQSRLTMAEQKIKELEAKLETLEGVEKPLANGHDTLAIDDPPFKRAPLDQGIPDKYKVK